MRRWLRLGLPPALAAAALLAGFAWFQAAIGKGADGASGPADAIVVLTGGAGRVEAGLALLEAGAAPLLLVSGAAPRLTLAELARAHGRDPAALEGRVLLGRAAATTHGNAAETAAWARARGLARLLVVTADYHMPRAMLELGRALPQAELRRHPVPGDALPRRRRAWLTAEEYGKYLLTLAGLAGVLPAIEAPRR